MINPFPIKFYTSLEQQEHYKPNCQGEFCDAPIVPNNYLPFFVIEIGESSPVTASAVRVFCADGSVPAQNITPFNSEVCTFGGTDYYIHRGQSITAMDCGLRYVRIDFSNGQQYYSSVFRVGDFTADTQDYWRIKWRNLGVFNNIPYNDDFNYIWIDDQQIYGIPEYRRNIESIEDGFGKETKTLETLEKYYTLDTGAIQEFMVDAIEVMAMHDDVYLFNPNTGIELSIKDLEVSTEWMEGGCSANSTIKFFIEDCVNDVECQEDKDLCITDTSTQVANLLDASQQSTIEGSGPSDGDSYYIDSDTFSSGNTWSDNLGKIATWSESGMQWVYSVVPDGTYLENSIGEIYLVSGGISEQMFVITSATYSGSVINVTANIPEGTWADILTSTDGVNFNFATGPVTKDQLSSGVGALVGVFTQVWVRISPSNHNCDYSTFESGSEVGPITDPNASSTGPGGGGS